jgi:hypothetical protein
MSPSPVCIDSDRALDITASAGCTLGPSQGGLALSGETANLLSPSGCNEHRGSGEGAIHCEQKLNRWMDELTGEDVMRSVVKLIWSGDSSSLYTWIVNIDETIRNYQDLRPSPLTDAKMG